MTKKMPNRWEWNKRYRSDDIQLFGDGQYRHRKLLPDEEENQQEDIEDLEEEDKDEYEDEDEE